MKPITPEQVISAHAETIPADIIEATNEMIARHWNGSYSSFTQDDLMNLILSKRGMESNNMEERRKIYENHHLDIEDIYRNSGWVVVYDKPGYDETYKAFFKFSKRK